MNVFLSIYARRGGLPRCAACRLPGRGILCPVMTERFYHDSTISLPVQVFLCKKRPLHKRCAAVSVFKVIACSEQA